MVTQSQYARARTWLASAKDDWYLPLSKAATEELIAEHDALVRALRGLLDRYTRIVDSGDCGNGDSSTEAEVIAARAVLAGASK